MAKKLNIANLQPHIVIEPVAKDDTHYIHCNVLIVCEGEKTEPNYFKSFDMMKNDSGVVYEVNCDGGGINTLQVVDAAIELMNKAKSVGKPYDSVWVVFDKDDFDAAKFDNAIFKAEANGIGCAWSNQAFELWYVYHFDARSTAMNREDYKGVITKRVIAAGYKTGAKPYVYKKNDKNMRHILSVCKCDENLAIRYAEAQANSYLDKKYNSHDPCTMVFKLVRLLIGKDKAFNSKILDDIESQ